MPFTASQITRENDYTQTPQPDRDLHWWRVDLGDGRTGWTYVAASLPALSEDWIAAELNRQEAKLGHALEGLLVSSGFDLAMAPRPD
jgi:hypothetical protein